jgi:late competence protein required for DNA uptake (superfamily II DNA/RNA helicase)
MHKCEKCESEEMQDLLFDKYGTYYCRSCFKVVEETDIKRTILAQFGKRRKNEN